MFPKLSLLLFYFTHVSVASTLFGMSTAAAAAPATTYEYGGGSQPGGNPYEAYAQGGASAYQWPQASLGLAPSQSSYSAPHPQC
jgi:hypothetical protein